MDREGECAGVEHAATRSRLLSPPLPTHIPE
jgi:hypothetical protein